MVDGSPQDSIDPRAVGYLYLSLVWNRGADNHLYSETCQIKKRIAVTFIPPLQKKIILLW